MLRERDGVRAFGPCWSKCTGSLSSEIWEDVESHKTLWVIRHLFSPSPAMEEGQARFFLFVWRATCATSAPEALR